MENDTQKECFLVRQYFDWYFNLFLLENFL